MCYIYLFGVSRCFQHGTGHIIMVSFVGRGLNLKAVHRVGQGTAL